MTKEQIYADIAQRTGGDIYIGVVGPVRSGKSTFIKRFAELVLLPNIKNEAQRERALDELPQSAAGRTIMTTEPKFIPEKAVQIELSGGGSFRARLIDCVGYMVEGALGHEENSKPRLVKSPWFEEAVPFDLAAETGTRRVITEHATVGVAITTDGSIADIPREKYLPAEKKIIQELSESGNPYLILLNCMNPESENSRELARQMKAMYGHEVYPVDCLHITAEILDDLLMKLLYEFEIKEIAVTIPLWVNTLPMEHWLRSSLYGSLVKAASGLHKMGDAVGDTLQVESEYLTSTSVPGMDLAKGSVQVCVSIKPDCFYEILSEQTGLEIRDEADLVPRLVELTAACKAYDKIKSALAQVEATGYGIVLPDMEQMMLQEPVIVNQGGQYGVRLAASAPSLHIMRADIHTELSPTVGSEQQGEEMIKDLLKDFESDPGKLWNTNIFGKSLHELVNEGLQAKLMHMPQEARNRLQQTLERIINEGCEGLICILL